ncbi:uncharacterized protein si:dkey-65b12.12 [Anguilla anguilla]|uniref:uncharacterized protein si:dkey-65b12.12 n=1 Tax=Anguilla anguilla TaxID=7936 RepID=UPI0015B301B2|nr:uncharacterized protein si:dkey-65b12.12 [Anguilla anguilla]
MLCKKYWSFWTFLCCGLIPVMGQSHCQRPCEPVRLGLAVPLDADVLLPCSFQPGLLQEAQSSGLAVLWRQGQFNYLVELKLPEEALFWDSRKGRVEVFKHLFHEGNFSILMRSVQESDLGLYHCELFEGINCSIGCQEVELSLRKAGNTWPGVMVDYWYCVAGGGVFLLLLLGCACCVWCRCVKMQQPSHSSGRSTIEYIDNDLYSNVNYYQGQLPQEIEGCHSSSSSNRKQDEGNGQEVPSSIYACIAEFQF